MFWQTIMQCLPGPDTFICVLENAAFLCVCILLNLKMYKYAELIKLSTSYANKMNRLSNRIFGEVVRTTNSPSMKVVKIMSARPVNKDPECTIDYYPRHVETGLLMQHLRSYGLFRDEHEDFKEEMKRMRELRGKIKYSKNIDGYKKKEK